MLPLCDHSCLCQDRLHNSSHHYCWSEIWGDLSLWKCRWKPLLPQGSKSSQWECRIRQCVLAAAHELAVMLGRGVPLLCLLDLGPSGSEIPNPRTVPTRATGLCLTPISWLGCSHQTSTEKNSLLPSLVLLISSCLTDSLFAPVCPRGQRRRSSTGNLRREGWGAGIPGKSWLTSVPRERSECSWELVRHSVRRSNNLHQGVQEQ